MNRFVLLGDTNVGKTCLIQQYTKAQFNDHETATVGAAFSTANIDYHNEKVEVNIWDTAGQERFESIAPIYARSAIGAMIVFDLTCYESFQHLKKWFAILENRESVFVVVCGNKSDVARQGDFPQNEGVSTAEAENFCNQNDALYFETSAKTGENVADAFQFMFIGGLDKSIEGSQRRVGDSKGNAKNKNGSNNDGNVIDISNSNEKKEDGCC